MTAQVLQLSDYAHLKPPSSAKKLAYASVTSIGDYKLSFARGWLRFGPYYRRLTPEQAGDLSESLYWALTSSTRDQVSRSEPAPGLVVEGRHPRVSILGFGPPIQGDELGDLILELRNFYKRRARRTRG